MASSSMLAFGSGSLLLPFFAPLVAHSVSTRWAPAAANRYIGAKACKNRV